MKYTRERAEAAIFYVAVGALFCVGAIIVALAPSTAHAMTVADVPAIPPNAVEVCDHYHQTICPVVTSAAPFNVSAPNTIEGSPNLEGTIVRFEPINSEMGAWVRLARTGGQLWFPLRALTLLGAR